jgi:hypothetical protein
MRFAVNRQDIALAMLIALSVIALSSASFGQLSDTFTNWADHPAIAYHATGETHDPVAELNRRLKDGRVRLAYSGPSGYLRATLDALRVPVESQIAVFVQDSVQRQRISFANPRTIFFNDAIAVGWVRGGFIELAAQDPVQGVIFYMLANAESSGPRFERHDDCLSCHYSYATAGVPGMLVRSVRQFTVDHRTPFADRWGGWYVTGSHGSIHHLGNIAVDRIAEAAVDGSSTWPSFEGKFDTTGYLSPYSDIVALMLFEHQMHGMNLLSRIGWEARVEEYGRVHGSIMPALPAGQADEPVPMAEAARELVDYFLFVDEPPLTNQIRGSAGFAERFQSQGPFDRRGRSLRQLDLKTRLLRYPCSYLIYSDQFNALPVIAKEAVFRRLRQVLSGAAKETKYAWLSARDRDDIFAILKETKPGF